MQTPDSVNLATQTVRAARSASAARPCLTRGCWLSGVFDCEAGKHAASSTVWAAWPASAGLPSRLREGRHASAIRPARMRLGNGAACEPVTSVHLPEQQVLHQRLLHVHAVFRLVPHD